MFTSQITYLNEHTASTSSESVKGCLAAVLSKGLKGSYTFKGKYQNNDTKGNRPGLTSQPIWATMMSE